MGYVNSQNYCWKSSENPFDIIEMPLHTQNRHIACIVPRTRHWTPFDTTITGKCHQELIQEFFDLVGTRETLGLVLTSKTMWDRHISRKSIAICCRNSSTIPWFQQDCSPMIARIKLPEFFFCEATLKTRPTLMLLLHSRTRRRILLPLSMQFHVRYSNMWQPTPFGGHVYVAMLKADSSNMPVIIVNVSTCFGKLSNSRYIFFIIHSEFTFWILF